MAIQEEVEATGSPSCHSSLTVGLAINGSKYSKYAVRWALRRFGTKERPKFKFIHVLTKVIAVPTPMGNYIPIDKARSDIATAYKKDVECQAQAMLLFYKNMCDEKKVEADILVIKGDDVAETISNVVATYQIQMLVIGTTARSTFIRESKGNTMSSRICKSIPSFCTTYLVSKDGLSSVYSPRLQSDKSSSSEVHSNEMSTRSDLDDNSDQKSFDCSSSSQTSKRNQSILSSKYSKLSSELHEDAAIAPFTNCQYKGSSGSNFSSENLEKRSSADHDQSLPLHEYLSRSASVSTDDKDRSIITCASSRSSKVLGSDEASTPDNFQQRLVFSENKDDVNIELEKLRLKLKHVRGAYKLIQDESLDASQQISELAARRAEEEAQLREIHSRLDRANDTAQQEKAQRDSAEKQANHMRELVREEALQKQILQRRSSSDADAKQKLEKLLALDSKSYSTFTWEEIKSATISFSDSLKIGAGANGTVYRGYLHHTIVAIKVLHSDDNHKTRHFNQELEVLGKIRHPHLLMLLGACLDRACLVYEYMENGSLDDLLQCKGGMPPLPWFHRYRIAWETASALVFLHSTKPDPIIHRDLKPANILLNGNLVSKIGDVGLSTLLPFRDALSTRTIYKHTALVGTLFYMDPEYQRTGKVSAKSDTYALGMVILQLLTGKPPVGLAELVERALEGGRLADVLDERAGKWPMQEAHDLARLGLSCLEMRSKDRPDLQCTVLAELDRLNHIATAVYSPVQLMPAVPPSHFICPILKRVMQDPCIAADGYSYERNAIEMWLCENDVSPLTKSPLSNKKLVPNHSLLCAITSWQAK